MLTCWPILLPPLWGGTRAAILNDLADMRLTVGERSIPVNRAVLATIPYFEKLLTRVANADIRLVDEDVADDEILAAVDFSHDRQISVDNLEDFAKLITASECMEFAALSSVLDQLLRSFGPDEIFQLLVASGKGAVQRYAVDFVAKNFSALRESHPKQLLAVDKDVAVAVLSYSVLDVTAEVEVWRWAKEWLYRRRGSQCCAENNCQILRGVRWRILTNDHYGEVLADPLLTAMNFKGCRTWPDCKRLFFSPAVGPANSGPRRPTRCVLAVNQAMHARLVKKVAVLAMDGYAQKFMDLHSFLIPSAMRVQSVVQCPKEPSKVAVLLKSWHSGQQYAVELFDVVRGGSTPLASFPLSGEKHLCEADDELLVVNTRPHPPHLQTYNQDTKEWDVHFLTEPSIAPFGAVAVTVPEAGTFYLVGGSNSENWLEPTPSPVYEFVPLKKEFKTVGELTCRRLNPIVCAWGHLIVAAGGIWPGPVSTVEVFDTVSHTSTLLPDMPIPQGRYYDICPFKDGLLAIAQYPIRRKRRTFFYDPCLRRWKDIAIAQEPQLRISTMISFDLRNVDDDEGKFVSPPSHRQLVASQFCRPRSLVQAEERRLQLRRTAVEQPDALFKALTLIVFLFHAFHGFH